MEMKETKEAIIGALELGAFLMGKFKDGVQVADVTDIMAKLAMDAEFKAVIEAAYQDAEKIPTELKAIDLAAGLELIAAVIAVVPKVQALMAPKAV